MAFLWPINGGYKLLTSPRSPSSKQFGTLNRHECCRMSLPPLMDKVDHETPTDSLSAIFKNSNFTHDIIKKTDIFALCKG